MKLTRTSFRVTLTALVLGIGSVALSVPASASTSVPTSHIVVSGGMVRAGSSAARQSPAVANYSSCRSITYRGNAGYISVQESSNHTVAWGITMTPYYLSQGTWNVSTYLNGHKTSSGFNRYVPGTYTPHGSIPNVRAGQTFHVSAKVVNQYGTFVNVPNDCTTT
jgi:hypothetical protein